MDDVAQLHRLHHDHAGAVRAYVRRRIGPDDADDVVAEVFAVAWRRAADVPEEPRTWLLGIARKALGNRRRSDRRQSALLERLASEAATRVASAPAPGDSAVAGEGVLLRALATLSRADREVLLLTAWDGLSSAEAADVLGVRPTAVTSRLHRARRRLDRALQRGPDPDPTAPRGRPATHPTRPTTGENA